MKLTNRIEAYEAKREKLMKAAKAAKRANHFLGMFCGICYVTELKRILQKVSLCDKIIIRQYVSDSCFILVVVNCNPLKKTALYFELFAHSE